MKIHHIAARSNLELAYWLVANGIMQVKVAIPRQPHIPQRALSPPDPKAHVTEIPMTPPHSAIQTGDAIMNLLLTKDSLAATD